jgi:hypothetical protein
MKITLKKKNDPSDKSPLIVQWVEGVEGKERKRTESVAIGETLELPDDIAYEVMGRYRGLFEPAGAAGSSKASQHYANKGGKVGEHTDKAAHAE